MAEKENGCVCFCEVTAVRSSTWLFNLFFSRDSAWSCSDRLESNVSFSRQSLQTFVTSDDSSPASNTQSAHSGSFQIKALLGFLAAFLYPKIRVGFGFSKLGFPSTKCKEQTKSISPGIHALFFLVVLFIS